MENLPIYIINEQNIPESEISTGEIINVYNYDNITQEYISTQVAKLDPKDKNPLIPKYSTATPPLNVISDGNTQIFNGTSWVEIEDNRGTVYSTDTGSSSEFTELGILSNDLTKMSRPEETYIWNGSSWILNLDLLKKSVKEVIKSDFNAELLKGWTFNSIKMDCTKDDIFLLESGYNLAVSLNESTMDIVDYDNVIHSNQLLADIDDLLINLKTHYRTQWNKKLSLYTQIDSASTENDINLINW